MLLNVVDLVKSFHLSKFSFFRRIAPAGGDWGDDCPSATRRHWPVTSFLEIQLFNREKMLTIFGWNFEIEERCKGVHCVDLGESCPNFHFSVSPHVPFLNLLFEQIANSNEYFLAKFGVDTAENEPYKVWSFWIKNQSTIRYRTFPWFVSQMSKLYRARSLLYRRQILQ